MKRRTERNGRMRIGAILGLALVLAAFAARGQGPDLRDLGNGNWAQVLSRAPADEYFYGIGDPGNRFVWNGIDLDACATNGSIPKVNQAYVWGMGLCRDNIFFGTMANTDTLVLSGYLRQTNPVLTYYRASEYGAGIFGQTRGLPAVLGDWRPPRLYRYNLTDQTRHDLIAGLPPAEQLRLSGVLGIRAGGAAKPNAVNPAGAAVLAGPMLDPSRGCAFFFFNGTTGEFLGAVEKPEYTNIRRFVEVNGDLYAAVQLTNGTGVVIRWVNNPALPAYPFRLVEVGALDQGGADICAHEGRLFVTTWPGLLMEAQRPGSGVSLQDVYLKAVGLWMSPVVPADGLKAKHRDQWIKVWNVNDYETDKITAVTYGGGALCSFDGWLYFGTMHVPFLSTLAHAIATGAYTNLPGATPEQIETYIREVFWKTHRAVSVFRGRNFFAPWTIGGMSMEMGGEFQLLYGYENLWTYDLEEQTWSLVANKTKQRPLMGGPGFDNPSNCYTWVMDTFKNDLYVGTFDIAFPTNAEACAAEAVNPDTGAGGDLFRLASSRAKRFEPVSVNGLGNIANYGFRTIWSDPRALYIGTANPRNLLADPDDDLPDGGWELLAFDRRRATPWDMDGDFKADFQALQAGGGLKAWLSKTDAWAGRPSAAGWLSAAADYDSDGLADFGVFQPGTGSWIVWLSSRGRTKQKPVKALAGVNHVPVPADFDGDGKADFAVWNRATSVLTWRESRTGKIKKATPPLKPARPAVGDYNGNGRAQAVWYAPVARRWCVQHWAGKPVQIVTLWPRIANGVPVPGDYTGDGKTDFALYDPATGVFHVWDAVTRAHSQSAPRWRAWLPAPADYDGDGKTDFAWYHPKNRQLHVVYSDPLLVPETIDLSATLPAGARPAMTPAAAVFRTP